MGVLVPLYLAGLTALSLPLIFHLVRRTPRGRQEFSSLMFLSPTVPRLTRRSRLDQILLLLLRLAALTLIALAFSRPFLREAAPLSFADLTGKRVALLIDTSASMRRGNLWQQAIQAAEKQLDDLNPQDDVALFGFNDQLQTIIGFQQEGAAPIADKPQVARNLLKTLQPGWGATDLGNALVTIASELDTARDAQQSSLEPQIVVISDFQKGSRLEALQSFEWPERVPVITQRLSLAQTTNAHAHALPPEEGQEAAEVRVRVVNAADSRSDQFIIEWAQVTSPPSREKASDDRVRAAQQTPVYVPAGQSRIVRLPRPTESLQADRILLRGDDHDFDNTFFLVPPRKQQTTLLYAGRDRADDPEGLQFFLRLAVANDPLRQVEVRPFDASNVLKSVGDSAAPLVVVSQPLSEELQTSLTNHVERGGLAILVLANDEAAILVTSFLDDVELSNATALSEIEAPAEGPDSSDQPRVTRDERPEKYLLLGEIDFTHWLFTPFASPRYGDFTKIHFWKHRPVKLKSPATTRVLARFDNGDPAVLERGLGKGRFVAFTSGWQPEESQLALSSKFVPLVGALLDLAFGGTEAAENVRIGQAVKLQSTMESGPVMVTTPDGREIRLDPDHTNFAGTDQPGIYRAKVGSKDVRFAVNVATTESDTAPMDLEQLEQRGVRFGAERTRLERIERVRQQRDTELESRQKVWRWLIVVALVILILETWWAGRAQRKITA